MFDGHWYGMGGGFMWIIWILLIVVFGWAIFTAIGDGISNRKTPKSALDILKERYARGEIDQEEYEEKRKTLAG